MRWSADTAGSSRYAPGGFSYLPAEAVPGAGLQEGDIAWLVLNPGDARARALRDQYHATWQRVQTVVDNGAGAEQEALETISRLGLHNVVVRAKEFKDDEAREIARDGWDATRARTFERQKELGVIPADAELTERLTPVTRRILSDLWRLPDRQNAAFGRSVAREAEKKA